MGRIVKCCYCKKEEFKDSEETIIQLPNKKYAHKKCYEHAKREAKELDDLVEVIKRIHNISTVPPRFYPFLQDLRNGTNRCQGSQVKKSKQGYRYLIIKKTYEFYEKEIKQSLKYKKIDDINKMLMYSYAIVVNKVDKVRSKMHQEYLDEKANKSKITQSSNNQEEIVIDIKKNKQPQYSWLQEDKK